MLYIYSFVIKCENPDDVLLKRIEKVGEKERRWKEDTGRRIRE